jgi:hypothetical protein
MHGWKGISTCVFVFVQVHGSTPVKHARESRSCAEKLLKVATRATDATDHMLVLVQVNTVQLTSERRLVVRVALCVYVLGYSHNLNIPA